MESKFDIVTMVSAVGLAAYLAIAMEYVAHHDLGISLQEIRSNAIVVAIVIAVLITVDFLGKKLGRAK